MEEASQNTGLNVATAIALAGCAFESYNEPTRVSAKFQERSCRGTVTTYIDRLGSASQTILSNQNAKSERVVPHRLGHAGSFWLAQLLACLMYMWTVPKTSKLEM